MLCTDQVVRIDYACAAADGGGRLALHLVWFCFAVVLLLLLLLLLSPRLIKVQAEVCKHLVANMVFYLGISRHMLLAVLLLTLTA
jgi:hypothetical protein